MKKATVSDVAALAGVSIKTVSRVVNGERNVRDITRRKVHRAIETLDYQPDEHARQLAARRRTHGAKSVPKPGAPRSFEPQAPRALQELAETGGPMSIDWK